MVEVREIYGRLRGSIRKVVVGKDRVVDLCLISLLAGGHVLLPGNKTRRVPRTVLPYPPELPPVPPVQRRRLGLVPRSASTTADGGSSATSKVLG